MIQYFNCLQTLKVAHRPIYDGFVNKIILKNYDGVLAIFDMQNHSYKLII